MRGACMKFSVSLVWGALLLQLGGCIAVPALMVGGGVGMGTMLATDRRTPGAVIEDRGIETKAAFRIREALGDAVHVNVSSYNRLALITGEVPDQKRKAQIEKIILDVENVQKTVNEVAIMENASTTARLQDGILTSRIRAALIDEKNLIANAFKITTERGVVHPGPRHRQRNRSDDRNCQRSERRNPGGADGGRPERRGLVRHATRAACIAQIMGA